MIRIHLNGRSDGPGMAGVGATHGRLAKVCVVAIAFERWAELMAQSLRHGRTPYRNQFLPSEKASDDSSIESPSPKFLRITRRAAGTIFESGARCYEDRTARAVVPEETRTQNPPLICGQIGPPILIEVGSSLKMRAAEHRIAPTILGGLCDPEGIVVAFASCPIEKQLS